VNAKDTNGWRPVSRIEGVKSTFSPSNFSSMLELTQFTHGI